MELKTAAQFLILLYGVMPKRPWWILPLGGLAALLSSMVVDLSASSPHSLSDFDPHEVARLETGMWRSYYGHQKLRLFGELGELLRSQYHVPFWRSNLGAFHAARAAVVFQAGHNRAEYERALPDIEAFYKIIRRGSATPFPVEDAARFELEWWIVHRERARQAPGELERSLANLQACLYGLPAARFEEHGRARAAGMEIRDSRSEHGALSEADWAQIGQLLDRSWTTLKEATAR